MRAFAIAISITRKNKSRPMNIVNTPTALQWRYVTPNDKARYDAALQGSACQSADRAFANLYIWSEVYHHEIAFMRDVVLLRFDEEGHYKYLPPIGKGDLRQATDLLLRSDPQLCFAAATAEEAAWLLDLYPNTFEVVETRDFADYLYDITALATLSGKKLHAKRNHINAFTAANEWAVRPLHTEDARLCLDITRAWGNAQEGVDTVPERRAIERALAAFSALKLHGALLTVGDKAAAFTIGSILPCGVLDVHFEKALPELSGAYPVINREFVRMMADKDPTLTLVNREDDMGLENLRRAKLSYRPAILLRKFSLKQTQVRQI